jgi:hypothetical protein
MKPASSLTRNVDPAELGQSPAGQDLDLCLFAHVGENGDRLNPEIPGFTRDGLRLLLIGTRVDHNIRTFAGQLQHGRTADIAPRSGNQRDFPFKLARAAIPPAISASNSDPRLPLCDGHTDDLIVVLAHARQGLSLFTVDGSAAGLTRRVLKSMDSTRKFARLEFDHVAARPLGTAGGGAAPFARTMVEAAVCLANEMVGGAERLREDALAYAMMRMQFGRPTASFQSMKHKQADTVLEVELAKSAAYYAAASLDDGDGDAAANAHLAKACASDAYMQTAVNALQIHGGIGFTWDNDTHLWFKRAKKLRGIFGRCRLSPRTDAAEVDA